MNEKQRRRECALQTLQHIAESLRAGRPVPISANKYLLEVCEAALNGKDDPLQIRRSAGQQPAPTMAIARAVHDERKRAVGLPLNEVTEIAVKRLRTYGIQVTEVAGGVGGAAEKHYQRHRDQLEAADAFYAAKNAGLPPPEGTIEKILTRPKRRPTR